MTDPNSLNQMHQYVTEFLERDGGDPNAVKSKFKQKAPAEAGAELVPGVELLRTESETLEAIISAHRPVFDINNDKVDASSVQTLPGQEESAMRLLVAKNAATIDGLLRSVGRIDLPGDEDYPWIGTGWIIDTELATDIVVTNAHVARHFAEFSGGQYTFSSLPRSTRRETPFINFRKEKANTPSRIFDVKEVIYIGSPDLLDVAFIRVAKRGPDGQLSVPIKLAKVDPEPGLAVTAIGYPGTDTRDYDVELLLRIFGNVFNIKTLAPGRIMNPDALGVAHDCSTMPGSSGSILLNPETGEAVGLHFHGLPFKSNHAVAPSAIRKLIQERPWQSGRAASIDMSPAKHSSTTGSDRSDLEKHPEHRRSDIMASADNDISRFNVVVSADGLRLTVPLEISVRFGATTAAPATALAADAPRKVDRASAEAAAATVKNKVQTKTDVVGVRATYLFKDGKISNDVGVVLKVRPEASRDPKDYGLDPSMDGVPISIEMADLESLAPALEPDFTEAPAQLQNYARDLSDPRFRLDPITDDMTVTLHVSPEAGWRVLSTFFAAADYDQITIGMYNFTAPHIIQAVRDAIKPDARQMVMTIDRKSDDIGDGTKVDDWPEEKVLSTFSRDAGNRFAWTPASISGPDRLFATAYHIKVAVLGDRGANGAADRSKLFWLSSGNWASSNQAPLTDEDHPIDSLTWSDVKDYDRDWHAVVENEKLATVFRNHLEQDYLDSDKLAGREAAAAAPPDLIVPDEYFLEAPRSMRGYKAFAPKKISRRLTIQPVLTPDNYPEVVKPLIQNARKSVLFINQSFDIKANQNNIPPHYRGLLDALLERQQSGLDVRIIFRSGFGKERDTIRNAVDFGFDQDRIRFYSTCHTKGIIVDGKRVLLGSQNWTGAGTKPNRDASLLIDDEEAAQYFTEIFEFDWKNVATGRVSADHGPTRRARAVPPGEEAAIPSGFRLIPWGAWAGS